MSIPSSQVRTEVCPVCKTVHDLPLCPTRRKRAVHTALAEIIRQHDEDGCIAAAAFDAGRAVLQGHDLALLPADPLLQIRRSELIRVDSYGVHGSDFHVCRLCEGASGAGVLNNGIQHERNCPLGQYDAQQVREVTP